MRAVIYARYSSDLQREASIEDQLSLCAERVKREGWTLVGNYSDRATSGANILNRRGIQALLEDAKRGMFDIVVSEALDRVSRDQEDIAAIYKRLRHYEVAIFTLSEGRVDELHIGLKGTMNALFLKDLASKIRRGQRGRITSGFSAGGLSYGYQVVREWDSAGNVIRGKRSINESEAAIIRRIFMEYASGKSPRKIAAELNADGIPSPRGRQWNASTINGHRGRHNGILQNELYKGQLIHNRVRMLRDPDTGRRISRVNPETEWIRTEVSDLRTVSDELWHDAQQTRRRYSGRPAQNCKRPKRLFSGLLTCGQCGGAYTLVRPGKYGCIAYREKGTCTNGSQISAEQLERRVLAGIKAKLRDPELLAEFIHEFGMEINRQQDASTEAHSVRDNDLEQTNKRIARLVTAIVEGTDTPALRHALMSLEDKKAELEKRAAVSNKSTSRKTPPLPDLATLFHQKVERLETALNAEPNVTITASSILRTLINAIVLHPRKKQGKMPIEVHGDPSALFLIPDAETTKREYLVVTVVAEEGLEPPTRGL